MSITATFEATVVKATLEDAATNEITAEVSTNTTVLAEFTGERGPIGLQGPVGLKGDKGDTGDKGEKGDLGERGENTQLAPVSHVHTDSFEPSVTPTDGFVLGARILVNSNNGRVNGLWEAAAGGWVRPDDFKAGRAMPVTVNNRTTGEAFAVGYRRTGGGYEPDIWDVGTPTSDRDSIDVHPLTKGEKGDKGDKGDQGDTGLAGPVMNWRGEWASGVAYVENDGVSYEGSSYLAIVASPSTFLDPVAGEGIGEWALIAEGGAGGGGAPVETVPYMGVGGSSDTYTFTEPGAGGNQSFFSSPAPTLTVAFPAIDYDEVHRYLMVLQGQSAEVAVDFDGALIDGSARPILWSPAGKVTSIPAGQALHVQFVVTGTSSPGTFDLGTVTAHAELHG